jgi:putative PIN family toxin of toxin-antitoxin system
MRVVIDTNVLISAFIKPKGSLGILLPRLRTGAYSLLYSDRSLEELVDVLGRPRLRRKYLFSDEDVKTLLGIILLLGEKVVPTRRIAFCRDPKDDKFLEIAVAGKADAIVSGDRDLLDLNSFEGIPILKPSLFLLSIS